MMDVIDHVKKSVFYFQGYGKSLISFNQQINKIRFIVNKDQIVIWSTFKFCNML